MVVSVGVHLGSCSVLKLGVDRNVCLNKEGLVVVMYVGVGLVMGFQNNIGVVVGKSVGVCGSGCLLRQRFLSRK